MTDVVVEVLPSGNEFRLVEPVVYEGRREWWSIPAGFVTDFASIPSVVAWLITKLGLWTLPAILHDAFCTALAARGGVAPLDGPPVSARDADGIFRRVLREYGVDFVTRWLIWTGVRWGALFNPARRPGWLADAPRVLLISLAALLFVLPPVVLAAPALLLKRISGGLS